MSSDITLGGAMMGAVPAAGAPHTAHPQAAADASRTQRYPIEFTGSGTEYFRIWIVNLLLTLVTLGIYTPWARVRKFKYFYGNTRIGGHALDFHGEPRRMLRGYALVGVLLVLANSVGNISPVAGLVGFLAVALIWPALFTASLRFRLANTSWRGLRFRFTGPVAGSYKAFAVVTLPLLLMLVPLAMIGEPDPRDVQAAKLVGVIAIVGMLAVYAVIPWFWYLIRRYQHGHYAYAQLQTELRASLGQFYGVFLRTAGVVIVLLLVMGAAVGALMAGSGGRPQSGLGMMVLLIPVLIVGYVLLLAVPYPYFVSRMQNLLWSRTGNSQIRFKSDLKFRPFLWLTIKNWLLVSLTLGLYWPFAAVATARAKVEAISLHTRVSLDELIDDAGTRRNQDAAGDAAGDLMGIDLGL